MLIIHYIRTFPIANRRSTPIFVVPKDEILAACYATLMGALAFSLALFMVVRVLEQAKKRRYTIHYNCS